VGAICKNGAPGAEAMNRAAQALACRAEACLREGGLFDN
jgi:hypothetical protein